MGEVLLDRYELVRELGRGSMGVVWLAHDGVLDRLVALKEMRVAPEVDQEEAVERFVVEAQAAARLSHPAIVTVHDVFAQDDRVLMSLELLDGPTLSQVIANGGLGAGARPVMLGVAEALAEAHVQGVVHRDLKPDNIFILPSGRVVVCDFGVARIGVGRGTHVGTVMGTPSYMAPEQIRGERVGPAADVFAWGAVAYELASGTPPFGDGDVHDFVALSWRVVHEEPTPLVLHDDPGFWAVIATALEKDPAVRFASGQELVEALRADWTGAAGTSVPASPVATGPRPARSPALVVAGILGGLAVLGLLVVLGVTLLSGAATTPADHAMIPVRDTGDDVGTTSGASTSAPTPPASQNQPTSQASKPTVTPVGPAGADSPDWQSFIVQVASRPKTDMTRSDVEQEAASSYGGASPQLRVLESDPYFPALRPGYWVIYAGPFAERHEAAVALDRIRGDVPSDAHVRHLDEFCPQAPCT